MGDLLMNGAARYLNDRHHALQSGGSVATESRSRNRGCRGMAARRGYTKGIRRRQGIGGQGGPQNPRFCETKPFVMLNKTHLYHSERMGCADYRKMTNGFVFLFSAFIGRVRKLGVYEMNGEDPVFFLCSRWCATYNSLTGRGQLRAPSNGSRESETIHQ